MIIDVSRWQGVINWDAVNGAIDGAIIQCGFGDDIPAQDDPYFYVTYRSVIDWVYHMVYTFIVMPTPRHTQSQRQNTF